jgi:hypothetical protein
VELDYDTSIIQIDDLGLEASKLVIPYKARSLFSKKKLIGSELNKCGGSRTGSELSVVPEMNAFLGGLTGSFSVLSGVRIEFDCSIFRSFFKWNYICMYSFQQPNSSMFG